VWRKEPPGARFLASGSAGTYGLVCC
jgi:hypothetical protein